MEIIHLSVDTPMQVHDSVCALGFFDGVHLGHQQLLKEVEHIAKEKGLKKAIMTFSVHPKQILENNNYHYLMSLSEKINILKQKPYLTCFRLYFLTILYNSLVILSQMSPPTRHEKVIFKFFSAPRYYAPRHLRCGASACAYFTRSQAKTSKKNSLPKQTIF